ncbi:MAG: ABC transporter ATP-binding protein [Rhodospirillales bacterium]
MFRKLLLRLLNVESLAPLRFLLRGRVLGWIFLGNMASLCLGGIEMAVGVSLQLILQALGFQFGVVLPGPLANWEPTQLTVLLVLIILIALRGGLTFVSQIAASFSQVMIQTRGKMGVFFQLLQSRSSFYLSAAEINFRHTEMVNGTVKFVASINRIVNAAMTSFVLLASMLWLSWELTVISLVLFGSAGALVLRINRWIRTLADSQPEIIRNLMRGTERVSRNWILIRVLRTQDREYEWLANAVLAMMRLDTRMTAFNTTVSLLPMLIGGYLVVALIYANFAWLHVSSGVFVTFLYVFLRFQAGVATGMAASSLLTAGIPHFRLTNEILSQMSRAELDEALKSTQLVGVLGGGRPFRHDATASVARDMGLQPPSIIATNLCYRYGEGNEPVFRNLSLSVSSGGQVAIVGPSGSGKSTLLACILGVLNPVSGHVEIDGHPAATYFRQPGVRVGYVGAEAFLIEGTVADNLRYGVPTYVDTTDAACHDALRRADLGPLLDEDEDFLYRPISENGDGLSAGEKQRLALARAFLAKPHVMILDEVSANLDDITESRIVEAVASSKGRCTTIIVSHRNGMLRHADQVISMVDLKSQGTPPVTEPVQ